MKSKSYKKNFVLFKIAVTLKENTESNLTNFDKSISYENITMITFSVHKYRSAYLRKSQIIFELIQCPTKKKKVTLRNQKRSKGYSPVGYSVRLFKKKKKTKK